VRGGFVSQGVLSETNK